MTRDYPQPPEGMDPLPNGDFTTHKLEWRGMTGSEWCHCVNCDYAPNWNMTAGPTKTVANDADLTCPKTGRTRSP